MSDAASHAGDFSLVVQASDGRLFICGTRGLEAGDRVLWDGKSFAPGLDVFEEGHDPLEEFLKAI